MRELGSAIRLPGVPADSRTAAALAAWPRQTVWMSGRSYANLDPIPFDDVRYVARRLAERPISTELLAVIVVHEDGGWSLVGVTRG